MLRHEQPDHALVREALAIREGLVKSLLQWWALNKRAFPWREDRTPYRVLVSELLLKRTTSKAAAKVFNEFLVAYPDIRTLAAADPQALEALFSRVGLQKQRAKAALEMARHICSRLGGKVPKDYAVLLGIPGVGDYTASAVLSFGYGVPVPVVDSNVIRVLSRVFNGKGGLMSINTVEALARLILPKDNHVNFNYSLLDIGAMVCKYTKPTCQKCPISNWCKSVQS